MTVVIDHAMSALSLRIFSMFTRAAPGSTSTSSSGYLRLMTSAVAAAMGVHVPPVGPAEKVRLTFCCAPAGATRSAVTVTSRASRPGILSRAIR